MSYDLMVFEESVAPKNRKEFMEWYSVQIKWSEKHGYDDPSVTSHKLNNWFMGIIKKFPPINGRGVLQEEIDIIFESGNESYLTDYTIGTKIIYISFSWTIAEEAYETVKMLAIKNSVGFFDVSSSKGDIVFSDGIII
ncbi:TPA: hypothetical protein ACG0MZ_005052 [Citrobacter farmeri]